jgi:hypothetical protein
MYIPCAERFFRTRRNRQVEVGKSPTARLCLLPWASVSGAFAQDDPNVRVFLAPDAPEPSDCEASTAGGCRVQEPESALSIQDALSLALASDPELQAASWEVRAKGALSRYAGLRES